MWIMISIPPMLLVTCFSYRSFQHWAYLLFFITLLMLIAVFFMPARNGSHRWIPIGSNYLQPSELAKLAYIICLARCLMYRKNYRNLSGLLLPFLLTMIPVGLILKEPDLGTSLVFIPVLFAMLFTAGARARHLVAIVLLGVMCLPVLWVGMSVEQKSRVVSLFTQEDGGVAPKGDGYHLHQSKHMLALGGFWGSEMSRMPIENAAAYHLPAGRTDFIYCLVGERWGTLGGYLTLLLFIALFARGLMVAAVTREPFGRLIAVGVVSVLAAQTIINTGMTVGLMPITGLTLPLMSYGGSSMLSTCIAIGLLMNVAMRPGYEMTPEPFKFHG